MKKIFFSIIVVILILLFIFVAYQLIKYIDYKSVLSSLEKYTFLENEITIKSFEYDNKIYVISRYYDNSGSWSHLNLLLKYNNTFYILEKIKNCDTVDDGSNLYLKDNKIYVHCIGREGNIDKYLINDLDIEKETLNFKNTPNISQLHIGIDKVDNKYIYLSSPFKVDITVKDEPKVKCSFKEKKCIYY